MKIVYLIAGTYNAGGMERVLANKANWLATHGHEVTVVTTDQRGRPTFFRLDDSIACYDLAVNYETDNGRLLSKLLRYPARQLRHRALLSRLLKQLKADIVVSMFCNDATVLPLINDGSKKILEAHFSRFKRLQYGRQGLWRMADIWRSGNDRRTAARYDRFVVLTKEDKNYWGDMPNVTVIHNARTFSFTRPAQLDSKTVIAVGRYCHQKGFDRLIAAWGIVCCKIEGWRLEIVGDGDLRQELLNQTERLGLSGKVVLRKVPADGMEAVYTNASIMAMSSRYEGLPMVLLEAQAAGLPIVSFACKCGPRDIVEDGVNGFLVEENNIQGLADALIRLIRHDDLRKRMGKAAYRNSERFSMSVIMKQWESLFNEVAGDGIPE